MARPLETHHISPQSIDASPPRRHDGRVARQSVDPVRLHRLDRLVVEEVDATVAVSHVCDSFSVPEPNLRFHARRSRFTGATERPRHIWVALLGEPELARREENGWGVVLDSGVMRLGRAASLMTIAHELGHHLVFWMDPAKTAAHGNVWVGRFDDAAAAMEDLIETPIPVAT
jgi:hypothetical protein